MAFSNTSERWYEGIVVLEDREVLTGLVKINEVYDALQLKDDRKITCIPARQIEKLAIHDSELGAVRNFVVIPSAGKSINIHEFYEIIIKGEVKLLAKEKSYQNIELAGINITESLFPNAVNEFANNKDFFFFDGKNLVALENFRNVVLPAFKRQFDSDISDFINTNKINLNYPRDQIRILKYFNKLYEENKSIGNDNQDNP
jgi:hypothetical protein